MRKQTISSLLEQYVINIARNWKFLRVAFSTEGTRTRQQDTTTLARPIIILLQKLTTILMHVRRLDGNLKTHSR